MQIATRSVLFAVLLVPAVASAQPEAVQLAKQAFDDGQNLYLQLKYEEAGEKFLEAYKHKPYPAFVFNAAVCYEKNRDFVKALQYYERFIKEDPHSNDRKLVEERIAKIRQHLNPPVTDPATTTSQPTPPEMPSLPPIETKGLVVIESSPEGAAIYLNEKKTGIFTRTPYTGSLPPGAHTVIIELKDYRTERKTFIVRNDRLTYLYFGLSVEKNLGWLEVKANVPRADVYIDERSVGVVGRTPYSGNQRPGKRKVIIEKEGYEPVERMVDIIAGKNHVVDVQLRKVMYGWVKVTGRTTRGATVKVDGKPIKCEDHPCRARVDIGSHTVVVQREGYKDYEHDIEVARTEEVKLAVRLNPKPSRLKAYVSFGVAAALLTGGIVTGVMSKNRADSLQEDFDNRRLYDSGDPRFTEGKVTAIIANAAFGLSGVVAALGVYYLLRNEGPDSYGEATARKLAITPTLGPNVAGVTGSVRF